MDAINDFILLAAASPWLVVVLFAVTVIDGFFPPVPSEAVLVAAIAATTATGASPTIALLCIVAAIGALVGDNIAYSIGRAVGTTRFRWMRGQRVSAAFTRAGHGLSDRGAPLILGARYVPVGRVAVNMSAGALRFPWRRFLPLSAIAAASWAIYSTLIGLVAGRWLAGQPLLSSVIGVGFAVMIGVIIDRISTTRRTRRDATGSTRIASTQEQIELRAKRSTGLIT